MKIALFGSKDFDSLEYHLSDALRCLEHEVFHIDIKDLISIPYVYNYWAIKFFRKYSAYLGRRIADRIISSKPDLIICTYRFTHPDCIKQIKMSLPGVPVAHINPDALTTFEEQQIFASPYDAYFTKDPYIASFMKSKMGLNTHYFPEAFNPRVHKPVVGSRIEIEKKTGIDVLTFGSMYPYRTNMIKQLIDGDVDVTLFGKPDWRFGKSPIDAHFNNEFITGQRKSELLYGAKVVFNNFHYAEIESVNVKFFEIAGIGGFQICDYKPTINEYSILDPKDFTYTSIGEAQELIKHYLDKPQLRHEMAAKQLNHFMQYHTYDVRVQQLLAMF